MWLQLTFRAILDTATTDLKKILDLQKRLPRVFYKKLFLNISQNSQENMCGRFSFLIKLQFTFFTEHLGTPQLLLELKQQ